MIEIGQVNISGAFVLEELYEYRSIESVNEKSEVVIKGRLKKGQTDKIQRKETIGSRLDITYVVKPEPLLLFCGLIKEILIDEENNLIQVIAVGLEYGLDLEKGSQSFQDMGLTYMDMIRRTLKEQGRVRYYENTKGKPKSPIIRFQETEWEFIRRLAGYMGTIMYPIATSPTPLLALGVQNQGYKNLDYIIKESFISDNIKYLKNKNTSKGTYISVNIVTNQHLNLGDKVQYWNKIWIVMKKEVKTINSILVFRYIMGNEQSFKLECYGNTHLKGGSLRGRVIETRNEKVKLHLDIDQKQDIDLAYFFPYKPSTGNIMYSMPEVGEYANLYFPDEYESNGYVVHGIKDLDNINREVKLLRTPNNKKIEMTPSNIELTSADNDHVSKINLIDDSKIAIETIGKISLKAVGKIRINCAQSALLLAANSICLKQTNSQNKIDISGNDIEMSAEKYHVFPTKHPRKIGFQGLLEKVEFQEIDNNLSLLGAFTTGDNKSIIQQYAMGSIPVCTFPENPNIQNGIGVHVGRKI